MTIGLSVIIPTVGRATLARALDSLLGHAWDGDQAIVVADGPSPEARAIAAAYCHRRDVVGGARVVFLETPARENLWGCTPRRVGIERARALATEWACFHVSFLDDDDWLEPGARQEYARVAEAPDDLWMFRGTLKDGSLLWKDRQIEHGIVGTPCPVVPIDVAFNARSEWRPVYAGDYWFIRECARHAQVRWDEALVYRQGERIVLPPTVDVPRGTAAFCNVCHRVVYSGDLDLEGRCCYCTGKPYTERPAIDIQGWFWWEDAVLALLERLRPAWAVEVGSWLGRSAVPQALALKKWGGRLVCVDPFDGRVDLVKLPELREVIPQSEAICRANLKRFGCDNAEVWRMTSVQGAAEWKERKLPAPGFVYVDGAHDEKSVREDLPAWWRHVRWGGAMAGDDYGSPDFPGVTTAWHAFAEKRHLDLKTTGGKGNRGLVWVEKG